jgi:hypothetical protein
MVTFSAHRIVAPEVDTILFFSSLRPGRITDLQELDMERILGQVVVTEAVHNQIATFNESSF